MSLLHIRQAHAELRRAMAMAALSPRLVEWLGRETASLAEEDIDGVMVETLVGVAVAVAAGRCADAPAAVALIRCIAESAAADIYGGEG